MGAGGDAPPPPPPPPPPPSSLLPPPSLCPPPPSFQIGGQPRKLGSSHPLFCLKNVKTTYGQLFLLSLLSPLFFSPLKTRLKRAWFSGLRPAPRGAAFKALRPPTTIDPLQLHVSLQCPLPPPPTHTLPQIDTLAPHCPI